MIPLELESGEFHYTGEFIFFVGPDDFLTRCENLIENHGLRRYARERRFDTIRVRMTPRHFIGIVGRHYKCCGHAQPFIRAKEFFKFHVSFGSPYFTFTPLSSDPYSNRLKQSLQDEVYEKAQWHLIVPANHVQKTYHRSVCPVAVGPNKRPQRKTQKHEHVNGIHA